MRPVILVLCAVALLGMACSVCCADTPPPWTLSAPAVAPDTVAVQVEVTKLPGPAACPGGRCATCPQAVPRQQAIYRSSAIVRGQPVRNVGRVALRPVRAVRAVVAARPIRRVGAAIFRARPLARVARGVGWLLGR